MIAIFDYGAGNLRSVENTLDALGVSYEIVRESGGLARADRIILPGVGHFGQLVRSLDALGVRQTLKERIADETDKKVLAALLNAVSRLQP